MHGFGFANVLRELGLPSKSQELVASLLAFNVGVEIGQVAIVAVLLPLVLWVGRGAWRGAFIKGVSVIVLLFGLGWLVERVVRPVLHAAVSGITASIPLITRVLNPACREAARGG